MLKTAFEKLFEIRESAARNRPGADEGFDNYDKPFLDHLEDLRVTLFKIIGTLTIATIACFAFHKQLFQLIQLPAKLPLARLKDGVPLADRLEFITLNPPEIMILMLKLSFFSGLIITFPFTIYFLFQFILPGLRQVEKKTIIPGAGVGFVLFLIGVCFAFFLAAPIALKFLYNFENERISIVNPSQAAMQKEVAKFHLIGLDGTEYEPLKEGHVEAPPKRSELTPEMQAEVQDLIKNSFATVEGSNLALRYDESRQLIVVLETKGGRSIYRIGEYINFISRLMLVFGISFQLPVVVTILVRLELLTAQVMRSTRSYAWVVILVVAAILTPPDILTLGLLGGPMIILYEICIIIATMIESKRAKRQLSEEEARAARLERIYSTPRDELSDEEKELLHQAEVEQYEREHAEMFEAEGESAHQDEIVARDSLHGGDSTDETEDKSSESDTDDREPDHHDDESYTDHFDEWEDHGCCESGPAVDLNHAPYDELMTLPGMVEELAQSIMENRPFANFEEVEDLPDMGGSRMAEMMGRLMLGEERDEEDLD